MSNYDDEQIRALTQKANRRQQKKRPKMKVSGKQVLKLKKIITSRSPKSRA